VTIVTRRSSVTFTAPFIVKGVAGQQPAGTYQIETDEEVIEGNDHVVRRRIATLIFITRGAATESWTIDPADLAAAIANDSGD
jgi:hypothetical protein